MNHCPTHASLSSNFQERFFGSFPFTSTHLISSSRSSCPTILSSSSNILPLPSYLVNSSTHRSFKVGLIQVFLFHSSSSLSISSSFYSFNDSPPLPNPVSSPTHFARLLFYLLTLTFMSSPFLLLQHLKEHSDYIFHLNHPSRRLLTFYLVEDTLLHLLSWRRVMALRPQCK